MDGTIYIYSTQHYSHAMKKEAWISFGVLVVMHASVYMSFKAAQRDGKYTFSPASSVVLSEGIKCILSLVMFRAHRGHLRVSHEDVGGGLLLKSALLAMMYTANNIMTFYAMSWSDPATLILFKSMAPGLCALLLRCTGQRISSLQWACILMQCLALVIVQYDVCAQHLYFPPHVYLLLMSSVLVTAASSVWNQLVLKSYDVDINVQNALLYVFGVVTSLVAFAVLPNDKGFFEGYTWGACGLLVLQSLYGITVSFAYKYADVLIKNISNAVVVGILTVVSATLYHAPSNVHAIMAIGVILISTFVYMTMAVPGKEEVLPEKEPLVHGQRDTA